MLKKIMILTLICTASTPQVPLHAHWLDDADTIRNITIAAGIISGGAALYVFHQNDKEKPAQEGSTQESQTKKFFINVAKSTGIGLLGAGITYLFIQLIKPGYCATCHENHYFSEQVQTSCGHRFYETCLNKHMQDVGRTCPICNAAIFNVFPYQDPNEALRDMADQQAEFLSRENHRPNGNGAEYVRRQTQHHQN